ncbi:non-functional NADPH-dependent codeinone reductase 2-like [Iris pallida]|uniref:Non-functional NADPH-dependent codeinone reductase 2-like n=1 Tax=Iris pallida TaxID=29817 RepID=A0AAX6HL51_IRIPA|nr:non-functional NADPH-dependent codeinone reductase 2-like [Iris pallida]
MDLLWRILTSSYMSNTGKDGRDSRGDRNTRLDIAHDEVIEKVFKHQSSYI